MDFLRNWTIDLAKLNEHKYLDLTGEFLCPIDLELARMILAYQGVDENGIPKVREESREEFAKMIERVDVRKGMVRFKLKDRKGLGRRYAYCPKKYKTRNGFEYDVNTPTSTGEIPTLNPAFKEYYSSLISMPKVIKNTLFKYGNWIDLDQKKGHPTILFELGSRNGEDMGAYKHYLDNFDEVVAKLSEYYSVPDDTPLDKGDIKYLFNLTIYGGSHKSWYEDIMTGKRTDWQTGQARIIWAKEGKEMRNVDRPHPLYAEFKKKTDELIDLIYVNNKGIQDKVCDDRMVVPDLPETATPQQIAEYRKIMFSRKSRVMSYFCGIIENEITWRAYKYAYKNRMCVKGMIDWGYDGFTFPPMPDGITLEEHLPKMNEYVRKQTGFTLVEFIHKPFDSKEILTDLITERENLVIALPVQTTAMIEGDMVQVVDEVEVGEDGIIRCEIESDSDGIDAVWNRMKKVLYSCKGQYFLKTGNTWTAEPAVIEKWLLYWFMNKTDLYKTAKGKYKPYSRNLSGATSLMKSLLSKVGVENDDETFALRFKETTEGRLCFRDGFLDFKARTFYTWQQVKELGIEYYSCLFINRDFGQYFLDHQNPNHPDIVAMDKDIFEPLFNKKKKTALQFLSRGVAGMVADKSWAKYIGNRNCGKGVFEKLNERALGKYYATINSGNLLMSGTRHMGGQDIEKAFGWALALQFARLGVSQELPQADQNNKLKLNGELFKRLCGGGDTQKARLLFQNIVEFQIQARMVIMCNDCPPIQPADCLSTCYEFDSVVQFLPKEEVEKETNPLIRANLSVADPDIKRNCENREDWANCYIMLLFHNWTPTIVVNDTQEEEIIIDDDEQENPTSMETDNMSLPQFLCDKYEINLNHNKSREWFVDFEKIGETMRDEKKFENITNKKLGIELKGLGLTKGKSVGGNKSGYFGLKKKVVEQQQQQVVGQYS